MTRLTSKEVACCAHLRVEWRTEPCDGINVRGEVTPGSATRGWWECAFGCGAVFAPASLSASPEPQGDRDRDSARLDWLDSHPLGEPGNRRCVSLHGNPPQGMRPTRYWYVHLNGIGNQPHAENVRDAIDNAMRPK